MIDFIKKYRKIIIGGIVAIGGFILGILAGRRSPNIPSLSGNSPGASGHETTDQINSQRLAANSGKASGQLSGITDDNRRAIVEINQLASDNRRISDLAGKLDDLAR
jgi:hypothetical protein